ncbi:MAG: response regulator [Planctomycetota bacterium]|nr:response regulator [Planctomycetota bacterium]
MQAEIFMPGSTSRGTRYRVLLADDDAGVRGSLTALLDSAGFETENAGGGVEALELLCRVQSPASDERVEFSPFDFLVLDVHMPDLPGVELLRRIRTEFRWQLPALFVSGEASAALRKDVEDAGGFALLPKPVEPDLFRSSVRELVQTLLKN